MAGLESIGSVFGNIDDIEKGNLPAKLFAFVNIYENGHDLFTESVPHPPLPSLNNI